MEYASVTDENNSKLYLSPNQEYIVAYGEDKKFRVDSFKDFLLEKHSPVEINYDLDKGFRLENLGFSELGTYVFISYRNDSYNDYDNKIINLSNGKYIRSFKSGKSIIPLLERERIKTSKSEDLLISCSIPEEFFDLYSGTSILSTHNEYNFCGEAEKLTSFIESPYWKIVDYKNESLRFWSQVNFPKNRFTLIGFEKGIDSISFNKKSSLIAYAYNNNIIKVNNAESGDLIKTIKFDGEKISSIAFFENDKKLLITSDKGYSTVDIEKGLKASEFVFSGKVSDAVLSNDEKKALIFSHDEPSAIYGKTQIYECSLTQETCERLGRSENYDTFYKRQALYYEQGLKKMNSPRNRIITEYFWDDDIRSILESGNSFLSFDGNHRATRHTEGINVKKFYIEDASEKNRYLIKSTQAPFWDSTLKFSPNNKFLAIKHSNEISLFDVSNRKIIREWSIGDRASYWFLPDSENLFTLSYDKKTIEIKNIHSNELLFYYNVGNSSVSHVEVSPDSEKILWVESNGKLVVSPIKYFSDKELIDYFRSLNLPPLTDKDRKGLH
ncbi:hypothetical protein AB835_13905 [Candidatus Endobugula sertula]|uniref:Translation initiation factor beta propellor-like domain-containing protein n=1 Tax=Candidatus Endobugula sertula TaxID=62101 RepID=A0A1D2QLM8_9GAMM|nr:hypothetical protein AB835_13905 [Candidatus Endobugula sertula]